MDIEEALVAYLLDDTQLKTLIGNKLFPDEIKQSVELPAVVYQKISDYKIHTLTAQDPLERPVYQYTVFSEVKKEGRAIAKRLKTLLADFQGVLGGIYIQKIELQNEYTSLETSSDGTVKTFTETLEFEVNYIKE